MEGVVPHPGHHSAVIVLHHPVQPCHVGAHSLADAGRVPGIKFQLFLIVAVLHALETVESAESALKASTWSYWSRQVSGKEADSLL